MTKEPLPIQQPKTKSIFTHYISVTYLSYIATFIIFTFLSIFLVGLILGADFREIYLSYLIFIFIITTYLGGLFATICVLLPFAAQYLITKKYLQSKGSMIFVSLNLLLTLGLIFNAGEVVGYSTELGPQVNIISWIAASIISSIVFSITKKRFSCPIANEHESTY